MEENIHHRMADVVYIQIDNTKSYFGMVHSPYRDNINKGTLALIWLTIIPVILQKIQELSYLSLSNSF